MRGWRGEDEDQERREDVERWSGGGEEQRGRGGGEGRCVERRGEDSGEDEGRRCEREEVGRRGGGERKR